MQQNIEIPHWDQVQALPLSWSDKLSYLVHKFLTMEQTDCNITHRFEPGFYIREMCMPAGTLFIGRIHRRGHEVQLLSGAVIHFHDENSKILLDKPVSVHTHPGYQMVAYALTEVTARSIHPNPDESRDIEELEDQYFGAVQHLVDRGRQIEHEMVEKLTW